jgi:large subunit ribosomal protein L19e
VGGARRFSWVGGAVPVAWRPSAALSKLQPPQIDGYQRYEAVPAALPAQAGRPARAWAGRRPRLDAPAGAPLVPAAASAAAAAPAAAAATAKAATAAAAKAATPPAAAETAATAAAAAAKAAAAAAAAAAKAATAAAKAAAAAAAAA